MESKDIKNVEKPKPLRHTLLEMLPNTSLNIYLSAYKILVVRTLCSKLNKKFGRKIFVVTERGLTDHCVVTRLS